MPYLFNCYTIFKVNKMECMIYMCELAKYTLFDRAKYYYPDVQIQDCPYYSCFASLTNC